MKITLTAEEKQRALELSRAIESFFIATGKTNVRSTDLFDYLANHKLVEWDRHQGVELRRFLRRVHNAGSMDLIPQCKPNKGNDNFMEWHFVNVPPVGEGRKLRSIGTRKADTLLEEDQIRDFVNSLPHKPDEQLIPSERALRVKYKRAYDPWTKEEAELLLQVSQKLTIEKITEWFKRQPHVLKNKIAQHKGDD